MRIDQLKNINNIVEFTKKNFLEIYKKVDEKIGEIKEEDGTIGESTGEQTSLEVERDIMYEIFVEYKKKTFKALEKIQNISKWISRFIYLSGLINLVAGAAVLVKLKNDLAYFPYFGVATLLAAIINFTSEYLKGKYRPYLESYSKLYDLDNKLEYIIKKLGAVAKIRGMFQITKETIEKLKKLKAKIDISKLESLINKEFNKNGMRQKLTDLGFDEKEIIELILNYAEIRNDEEIKRLIQMGNEMVAEIKAVIGRLCN